jgi:ArsR family transcriptional regulator
MEGSTTGPPPILDLMGTLADGVRSRILLVLEKHELTVSELCDVVRLPQSTVSRHLRILGDDGWVRFRKNGTSRLYRTRFEGLPDEARALWQLVRHQVESTAEAAQGLQRLAAVLRRRRLKSREFFASAAGEWDRLRDALFGERFHVAALLGLVDERWTLGDLGCGTGKVSETIAPFVRRVVAVDESEPMLEAARRRLRGIPNVEVRRGELETLPIGNAELDAATLVLVLHHLPDPGGVLAEVARALRLGGRLLLVDMLPHDREEYRGQMGHVWLGFTREQIGRDLGAAGFRLRRFEPLALDPAAAGPPLFAASATLDVTRRNP